MLKDTRHRTAEKYKNDTKKGKELYDKHDQNTHIHILTCIHSHTYIYIHTYTHMHTYTHTYHTHTYMHTHIYILKMPTPSVVS